MLVVTLRFNVKDPTSWLRLLFGAMFLGFALTSFLRLNIDLLIVGYSKFTSVMPIPVWGLVQLGAALGLLLPKRENLVLAAAWLTCGLVFLAFAFFTTWSVGLNYGTWAYGIPTLACFLLMAYTVERVALGSKWVQSFRDALQGRREARMVRGHGGD